MSNSVSHPANKALLNEVGLSQATAEPPLPLFTVLRHAKAMRHLVVWIAVVPAVIASTGFSLNERNAWQGMAALNVLQAESAGQILNPAAGTALFWQSPLYSWLSALAALLFGTSSPFALTFVACLGGSLLVIGAAMLARRMRGDRGAVLTAVGLALSPPVLLQVLHPGPSVLAAGLGTMALVGLVDHWQRTTSGWSWSVFLGGISLGLSILAVPSLACAVVLLAVAAIALSTVVHRNDHAQRGSLYDSHIGDESARFDRVMGFVMWIVLALVVGAWWPAVYLIPNVSMIQEGAALELPAWGITQVHDAIPELQEPGWLMLAMWPILGLIVSGLLGLMGKQAIGKRSIRPGTRSILCAGLAASMIAGCYWTRSNGLFPQGFESVQLLLLVPPAIVASIGLLRILDRQASYLELVVSLGLPLMSGQLAWWIRGTGIGSAGSSPIDNTTFLLAGSVAVAFWILMSLVFWRRIQSSPRDFPRRLHLISGLALLLVLHSWWGGREVIADRETDLRIQELRHGLTQIKADATIIMVGPQGNVPVEIQYLVRSMWPQYAVDRPLDWSKVSAPISLTATSDTTFDKLQVGDIVLVWTPPERNRFNPAVDVLQPLGQALRFGQGELAQYRVLSPPPVDLEE